MVCTYDFWHLFFVQLLSEKWRHFWRDAERPKARLGRKLHKYGIYEKNNINRIPEFPRRKIYGGIVQVSPLN